MTCVQVACSQLLSKPRWRNPTSTSQWRTFSPSSFKLNLIVPWVAGWDGPICSSIISVGSSWFSAFIALPERTLSALARQGFFQAQQFVVRSFVDESSFHMTFGNPRLAKIDWIIFAQRMALKLIVEQYPAQIRMVVKAYAVKIPHFALKKIRSLPQRGQRIHYRIVLRHRHAYAQSATVLQ